MSLTLVKLETQLQRMSQEFRRQAENRQELLTEARRLLETSEVSKTPAVSPVSSRMVAIPAEPVPLDSAFALPPHPPRATYIATDGSAVEPDRHGVALYYLINVGSIVLEYGSRSRPRTESEPTLFFDEKDLYEGGRLVQGDLLDIRLATAEMAKLADLATSAHPPILALCDGPLLLWFPKDTPQAERRDRMRTYLSSLTRLYHQQAAIAGVISRPRHADVVTLLYSASPGGQVSRQEGNRSVGLTDRELFDFLRPGERSALFVSVAQSNVEYSRHRPSHEICFFYINIGTENQAEIARVEIPRWMMTTTLRDLEHYSLLDFAQAAIYAQCRIARSYPYTLARAHELAVITMGERRDLELRVVAALARQGLSAQPSEKARLKELLGSSRGRIND